MRNPLKALRVRALQCLGNLLPINRKRIRLLSLGYSGSNTAALYANMPVEIDAEYDVRLVPSGPSGNLYSQLRYLSDVGRAAVVVSTHGYSKWNRKQRNLELWHGFPLKGMNLMDSTEVKAGTARRSWKSVDQVASYSPLYASLMSACMGLDAGRFVPTGMPRNDLLWGEEGEALLDKAMGSPSGGRRVVFYLPTFRRGHGRVDGDKSRINILGFERFDEARFADFLSTNRIRFIAKLHPFEERVFLAEGGMRPSGGIELLTDRSLAEEGIELYWMLARADCLVTDYSSVYFDLLLRDVPMVFSPVDLEEYRGSRGFLMDPYELWTPGPKALDQESLEREILKSLEDRSYYAEERKRLRAIVHSHNDNRASERVWDAVLRLAGEGATSKE